MTRWAAVTVASTTTTNEVAAVVASEAAGSGDGVAVAAVATTTVATIKVTMKEAGATTSITTTTGTTRATINHSQAPVKTTLPKTKRSSNRTRKSMSTWMTRCWETPSPKKERNNNSDCARKQHRSHLKTSSEKISQNFKKYSKLVNDLS